MTVIRKVLAAVFAGLALTLLSAAPAAARADKLKLTVAGDGAEGVTIQATYADGRRLDRVVRLVLTATGPDGQKVGPVQLEPQPEGQGFYSSGKVLTAGTWKVTVNSPRPPAGQGDRHGAGPCRAVSAGAQAGGGRPRRLTVARGGCRLVAVRGRRPRARSPRRWGWPCCFGRRRTDCRAA